MIDFDALEIIQWPDDRLSQTAEPVRDIDEIHNGIKRLTQLMLEHRYGVGLAATQIGWMKRVFICKPMDEIFAFVNPEIVSTGRVTTAHKEGCLSFQEGSEGVVTRHKDIVVAYDKIVDGELVRAEDELTGFSARVFQHELDHLNGLMYFDRMNEKDRDRLLNPPAKKMGIGIDRKKVRRKKRR